MNPIYRIGLSEKEVNEEALKKSGFVYKVVNPRSEIVDSAKRVLGAGFKRGASVLRDAPKVFDCSSFTSWCAVEAGISIPRISIDQYVYSQRVSKENLEAGDLVFANTGEIIHTEGSYFSQVLNKEVKEEAIRTETLEFMPGTKVPQGIDHVGIYAGEGNIIHASGEANCVVQEKLEDSKQFKNIIGYGRIVNEDNKRFVIQIPENREDLRIKDKLIKEIQSFSE